MLSHERVQLQCAWKTRAESTSGVSANTYVKS
jgi:hypothetical protein